MEEHFNSMIQQRYQFPQMAGWPLLTYIGGGSKEAIKTTPETDSQHIRRELERDQRAKSTSSDSREKEPSQSSVKCEVNV